MYVIVFTPSSTREYGTPEVIGPFASESEAQRHLDKNVTPNDGWDGEVVKVENPASDRD